MAACCNRVRDAVLDFAARRNWSVVPHAVYVSWADRMITSDDQRWVVLDPLFPRDRSDGRVIPFRITRGTRGISVDSSAAVDESNSPLAGSITILDDAAATGTTLRHMIERVSNAGGRVTRIALCVSSRGARDLLRRAARDAKWVEFTPLDDWRTMHLRDGCAYLPYSGRSVNEAPFLSANGGHVELRTLTTNLTASLWHVLLLDGGIREAVLALRAHVPASLGAIVQRSATIDDLSLLGPRVTAPVTTGQNITKWTTLDALPLPA